MDKAGTYNDLSNEGWVPPDGVTWEAFLEEKTKLWPLRQELERQYQKEKKARCKAEGVPYSRHGTYRRIK